MHCACLIAMTQIYDSDLGTKFCRNIAIRICRAERDLATGCLSVCLSVCLSQVGTEWRQNDHKITRFSLSDSPETLVFLPRDAMHSADYAVVRCLSVTFYRLDIVYRFGKTPLLTHS